MMMMEFTGAKSREWVGSFGMCGLWSMGGVVIGMDGAVVRSVYRGAPSQILHEWQAVSILPMFLCIIRAFVTLLLPESPLWLAARGNLVEARHVLEMAAEINGASLPAGRLVSHTLGTSRLPLSNGGHEPVSSDGLGGHEPVSSDALKGPSTRDLFHVLLSLRWPGFGSHVIK